MNKRLLAAVPVAILLGGGVALATPDTSETPTPLYTDSVNDIKPVNVPEGTTTTVTSNAAAQPGTSATTVTPPARPVTPTPPNKPAVITNMQEYRASLAPAERAKQDADAAALAKPAPRPIFGQHPERPDRFVVYENANAMTQAGIKQADQYAADAIVMKQSGWIYKITGRPQHDLCIAPGKNLDAYPDFNDNPVSQLAWCNTYVTTKYASWNDALDTLNATGTF